MNLPKRAPESPVKRSDEETQDEIEQIMSEIEQLQKEIGQAEDSVAAPATAAAKPALASASRPKPALVKSEPVSDGPVIQSGFTGTDPLEEFRASAGTGGDGPGLEDTLSELKGEESRGGALDEILDSEPEVGPIGEDEHVEEFEAVEQAAVKAESETRDAIARASRQVKEAFEEEVEETPEATYEEDEEESLSMRDVSDDSSKGNDGSLTMNLKGNMTLKLQYECDGQAVTIGFSDNALRVQLADGTEFKIPMKSRPHARRSA